MLHTAIVSRRRPFSYITPVVDWPSSADLVFAQMIMSLAAGTAIDGKHTDDANIICQPQPLRPSSHS
jgi:hypothetical protein